MNDSMKNAGTIPSVDGVFFPFKRIVFAWRGARNPGPGFRCSVCMEARRGYD
jgi:hypothetical protein